LSSTSTLSLHDALPIYFGPVCALRNINVQVGRNEIVGLIGDNGAGKSTMVKILTGVHRPTRGELYIAGRKVDLSTYNVKKAHERSEEHTSELQSRENLV